MVARKTLVVLAAVFFTYAWFSAFTIGLTDFGVAMALCGFCLVGNGCIRYVQARRDEWRIGRECVWLQRERRWEA